jgi:hypothetical protein
VAHAVCRVARVDGAWVAVVEDRRRSGEADAYRIAELSAVAWIAVRAAAASGEREVQDARFGIARVESTGVVIVKSRRNAELADSLAITGIDAVADIVIGAGYAHLRRVGAGPGLATVRRAGVLVVAVNVGAPDGMRIIDNLSVLGDVDVSREERAIGKVLNANFQRAIRYE